MTKKHFRVVNPAALSANGIGFLAPKDGCGERSDAPVCKDGNTDVTCLAELYKGCETGTTDCANVRGGNEDDVCCAGWGPGNGDNIDHAYCIHDDAGWGGLGWCLWNDDGTRPAY